MKQKNNNLEPAATDKRHKIMTTIKSYTDLSQSKKLAEILPLESADMYYWLAWSGGVSEEKRNTPKVGKPRKDVIKTYWCPCWSLAALLSVVSEEVSLNSFKDGNWNAMVQQNGKMIYGDANNSVDACVEMIIKLHEQNLL